MKNKGIIVQRHPAINRGYERGNPEGLEIQGHKVVDLSSTNYPWIVETESMTLKSVDLLDEYIGDIMVKADGETIVVISSHKEVRDKLVANGYDILLVYPDIDKYREFNRTILEWDDREDVRYVVEKHWNEFIEEMTEASKTHSYIEVSDTEVDLVEVLNKYFELFSK